MVFVTMRDQNPTQVAPPFFDVCDVWDDEVDAALLLFGELRAAIEEQKIALKLNDGHVFSDFAHAAQRNDAKLAAWTRGGGSGLRLALSCLRGWSLILPSVPALGWTFRGSPASRVLRSFRLAPRGLFFVPAWTPRSWLLSLLRVVALSVSLGWLLPAALFSMGIGLGPLLLLPARLLSLTAGWLLAGLRLLLRRRRRLFAGLGLRCLGFGRWLPIALWFRFTPAPAEEALRLPVLLIGRFVVRSVVVCHE
jgi:hypothetical protein